MLLVTVAAALAAAQNPVVQITNVSRPGVSGFLVGDRFQIAIKAAPNQPVSVRTMENSRTDWGPVIGQTDTEGRWSTTGQFAESDFGYLAEVWTVGGLPSPILRILVEAPCLKDGQASVAHLGTAMVENCQTTVDVKSFGTLSAEIAYRTPAGGEVPGLTLTNMTTEQYDMRRLESLLSTAQDNLSQENLSPRLYGDQAAVLITKLIGVNGLSEAEMKNLARIVHAAFEKPDGIPQSARDPSTTVLLLHRLENAAQQASLKQQIAETINYVQLQ